MIATYKSVSYTHIVTTFTLDTFCNLAYQYAAAAWTVFEHAKTVTIVMGRTIRTSRNVETYGREMILYHLKLSDMTISEKHRALHEVRAR